jgi:CRP-like cAMP-binding protein
MIRGASCGVKISFFSGDIFGEMGIIDGSARSASIQAATKSLVLAIDGSVVNRQLQNFGIH